MKLFKTLHLRGKEYFENLLKFDLPAYKISLSLALGIFIGLTIPMGFQTLIVLPIAILLRCNFPVAWGATAISNPFTILPIYIAAAFIGEKITGIKISLTEINYVIINPTTDNFRSLGHDTFIVLIIGTSIIGLVLSVIVYYISLILITKHREKIKQD
jgi:uncharacterized protein